MRELNDVGERLLRRGLLQMTGVVVGAFIAGLLEGKEPAEAARFADAAAAVSVLRRGERAGAGGDDGVDGRRELHLAGRGFQGFGC